jgi:predicted DNA-binding transcriptional regulator AlpA
MIQKYPVGAQCSDIQNPLNVVRHNQVRKKLNISSAKLFDMIAQGQFPKPFTLVPNGRAVGWLEYEVDQWIIDRKTAAKMEAV